MNSRPTEGAKTPEEDVIVNLGALKHRVLGPDGGKKLAPGQRLLLLAIEKYVVERPKHASVKDFACFLVQFAAEGSLERDVLQDAIVAFADFAGTTVAVKKPDHLSLNDDEREGRIVSAQDRVENFVVRLLSDPDASGTTPLSDEDLLQN